MDPFDAVAPLDVARELEHERADLEVREGPDGWCDVWLAVDPSTGDWSLWYDPGYASTGTAIGLWVGQATLPARGPAGTDNRTLVLRVAEALIAGAERAAELAVEP